MAAVKRSLVAPKAAFFNRSTPLEITNSKQLTDIEYEEVMSFEGMHWQDVTFSQIEQNSDAVFWFSPDVFCYYLPGILEAGLTESRWDEPAKLDDYWIVQTKIFAKLRSIFLGDFFANHIVYRVANVRKKSE